MCMKTEQDIAAMLEDQAFNELEKRNINPAIAVGQIWKSIDEDNEPVRIISVESPDMDDGEWIEYDWYDKNCGHCQDADTKESFVKRFVFYCHACDPEDWKKDIVTEITTSKESNDTQYDQVNHPKHYTSDPSGVECIEITRHRNFNIGNAMKYLWRAGLKDSDAEVQDLEKAVWYIQDEIKRLGGANV